MSEALAREDAHPHDLRATVPDRLPAATVRALSTLQPARALGALGVEWAAVAAAIATAEIAYAAWPGAVWLYPLVVMFIGARQQAFSVIGHDAAHYRFLPNRTWNDLVGDALLLWPVFITVEGFRKFHAEHHQHLGALGDGNRFLWRTHRADGTLAPEWVYPKSPLAFAGTLLRRSLFVTGAFWMVRGVVGSFLFARSPWHRLGRAAWLVSIVTVLTLAHAWWGFLLYWVVPYCTWHVGIQYLRLICEHSAVPSDDPGYGQTRTTIPRLFERWLLLPRNIGYHIEHHWYPAVPFYRLPELHAALLAQPGFAERAVVTHSVWESVRQVTRQGARA